MSTQPDPALVGPGDHPAWIRAVIGLGESEAAHLLSARQLREKVPLLLLRTECEYRIHDQGSLNRGAASQSAVATLQLLHYQAVSHVVHAGAAVLLRQIGPEESQLGHFRDQFPRERPLLKMGGNHWEDLLFGEGPNGSTHHAFFFGEKLVNPIEVDSPEWIHAHLNFVKVFS